MSSDEKKPLQKGRISLRHADNLPDSVIKEEILKADSTINLDRVFLHRPRNSKCTTFVQFENHETAQKVVYILRTSSVFEVVNFAQVRKENTSNPNFQIVPYNSGEKHQSKIQPTPNQDEDQSSEMVGKCFRCNKSSSLTCENCVTFYCSVLCQKLDWQYHRSICKPLPRLVPLSESFSNSSTKSDSSVSTSSNTVLKTINNNISGPSTSPNSIYKPVINNISPTKSEKVTSPKNDEEKWDEEENNIFEKVVSNFFQQNAEAGQKSGSSSINRLSKKINIRYSFPKNHSEVYLTSIHENAPNLMFIQSKDPTILQIVANTISKVEKEHLKEDFLKDAPAKNDVVYSKYEDGYHRARVIEVEDNMAKVFYIDYGNVDKSDWHTFKHVSSEELRQVNGHIFKVMLIDLHFDKENCQKVYEYLNANTFTMPLIVEYEEDDQTNTKYKNVHLKLKESGVDLVEKVNKVIQVQIKTKEATCDNYDPVKYSDVEKIDLTCGDKIGLQIVDTNLFKKTKHISCVELSKIEKFKEIVQLCKDVSKIDFEPGTYPGDDDICLVTTEDQWFRAVCFLIEDKNKCMLIDFGTLADIDDQKHVKKIPKKLAEMPVITNIVKIANQKETDDEFLEKYQNRKITAKVSMLPDNEFVVEIE